MKPVWSEDINFVRTVFNLSAMQPEAILYITFNKVIGRQFLINCLGLSAFGMHVTSPCLYVLDNVPRL